MMQICVHEFSLYACDEIIVMIDGFLNKFHWSIEVCTTVLMMQLWKLNCQFAVHTDLSIEKFKYLELQRISMYTNYAW